MNHPESGTPPPVRRVGLIDQVGRNTVREALQSLVHAGLLSREQGRGTFVISTSELSGSLARQLAGGSRHHYLELRLALDSTAASLAALRRTDADIVLLRELRTRREASWATDDPDARAGADLALHRAIVAATHNPLYVQLYSSMTDVFASHMRDEESGDDDAAHRLHHDLVEAIAQGDAGRATGLVASIFEPFMR